ncbi:hypothetical protein [Tropicimonas sp. IMCC6043]|uniref:hypothetical protein n=1 Tax=Tropicimonas sp. IMCC6043 TaxID=2510645 RepID=UPI00101BBF0D|nr:hypothetical protein [Tropicimonas sp. IMCC6043]RYH10669.1 hypothetical protein EU800_07995 [Tropicimonas sp. IMCC6043]
MTGAATRTHATPARLPLAAMASVLAGFAVLQFAAYFNAGVFEYPLDDVYIHLAVAEQIASGGYGVNPGEYASASSSPPSVSIRCRVRSRPSSAMMVPPMISPA